MNQTFHTLYAMVIGIVVIVANDDDCRTVVETLVVDADLCIVVKMFWFIKKVSC